VVYTVPTFHNPTGTCLTGPRRRELLRLATRHDLAVVEDDFAGDLRHKGRTQPAIKALDRQGVVVHLGTFSKMLAPGLRVGYVVADGPVLDVLTRLKSAHDLTTSPLIQRAVERFVTVGRYQAHLRRTTRIYRKRRDGLLDALRRELPGCQVQRPAGGLFAWVRLPLGTSARRLVVAAAEAGVVIAPETRFYARAEDGDDHIRLNFACRTEEEVTEGIARLARVVAAHRTS
jgi:GntR family transcriptional regulator/MocR family aminotransferase